MNNWYIAHSAKGTQWKKHKYIRKEGNRYIYPTTTARGENYTPMYNRDKKAYIAQKVKDQIDRVDAIEDYDSALEFWSRPEQQERWINTPGQNRDSLNKAMAHILVRKWAKEKEIELGKKKLRSLLKERLSTPAVDKSIYTRGKGKTSK